VGGGGKSDGSGTAGGTCDPKPTISAIRQGIVGMYTSACERSRCMIKDHTAHFVIGRVQILPYISVTEAVICKVRYMWALFLFETSSLSSVRKVAARHGWTTVSANTHSELALRSNTALPDHAHVFIGRDAQVCADHLHETT
jgi:hypothetical protein